MDFNDKEHVEQFFDHLFQLAEKMACGFCDRNFVDPNSLKCSHRFCSKCIRDQRKSKDKCPTCEKPVLNQQVSKVQTDVKLFQASFIKLLKTLEKKYLHDSARIRVLKDFMHNRKPFTQVKLQYEASDDQEVPYEPTERDMKENLFINFNTSYNIINNINNDIVDETMDKSFGTMTRTAGDVSMLSVDETFFEDKKDDAKESSVKKASTSKNSTRSIDLDLPERDLDSSDDSSDSGDSDDSDDSDDSEDSESMDESEETSSDSSSSDDTQVKDTPSQYSVKKQRINYAHKEEDRFDRVVKSTEKKRPLNQRELDYRGSPELPGILDFLESESSLSDYAKL